MLQSHGLARPHGVIAVVRSGRRHHGRLRVGRGHGQVRRRRRLDGPKRRVLHWGHRRVRIGCRGYRRVRRLGRLRVAIVAVQRTELRTAVERRQRWQLRAIVLLLAQGRVLRQTGLAEAVSVHGEGL